MAKGIRDRADSEDRSGRAVDSDPVVTLLYLLMRDHLPVGVVTGVVNSVWETSDILVTYSNKQLLSFARELKERLSDDGPEVDSARTDGVTSEIVG